MLQVTEQRALRMVRSDLTCGLRLGSRQLSNNLHHEPTSLPQAARAKSVLRQNAVARALAPYQAELISIQKSRLTEELDGTGVRCAQRFGDANRRRVCRTDETDDVGSSEGFPTVAQRGSCAFRRKATTPVCSAQCVCQLKPRPAVWLPEADAPQQRSRRSLLYYPDAEAAKYPVAGERGHLSPRIRARDLLPVADVTSDLRVAHYLRVSIDVALLKSTEDEPGCRELGDFNHRRRALSQDASPRGSVGSLDIDKLASIALSVMSRSPFVGGQLLIQGRGRSCAMHVPDIQQG